MTGSGSPWTSARSGTPAKLSPTNNYQIDPLPNVELQQLRDMVEAGPFFKLDDASFTNNILTLEMINVGAPVICLDFRAVSPRAHVLQWSPSALTNNERFRAPTHLDDGQERECLFHFK